MPIFVFVLITGTALAIAAIVAAVASAAAAGYAAYQQADAAATNKRAVEAETAFRVRQEENEAQRIRNKGLEAEARQRRENALLISRQRAQLGASGVDIESGSALALQDDSVTLGKEEVAKTRDYFDDQAKAMDMRAVLTAAHGKDKAKFYGQQKTNALVSGGINIVASLAGGLGSSSGLTPKVTGAGGSASTSNVDAAFVNNNFLTNSNSGRQAAAGFGNTGFSSKWNAG